MINVALIGCGKVSVNHVNALCGSKNFVVRAVCDLNIKAAKEIAKRFGTRFPVTAYTDQDEMLNEYQDVALVVICTPPNNHIKVASAALTNGRAVLIEKPIARTCKDARKLLEFDGSKIYEVKQNRYNAAVMTVKAAIEAGAFGKIHMLTARLRWCRNPEYYASEGWRGTDEDGGVFASQGCHLLDLVRYLGGECEVKEARMWNVMDLPVEDSGYAFLEFGNGARGLVELTTAARPENLESSISILGDKGSVVIGGDRCNKVELWKIEFRRPQEVTVPTVAYRRMYAEISKDLDELLHVTPANVVTLEDAAASLKFIESIYDVAAGCATIPDRIDEPIVLMKEFQAHILDSADKNPPMVLPVTDVSPEPIIYVGNTIGMDCQFGHYVLIRENNEIGDNVRIGSYTEIAHDVRIDDNVQIHSKCFIPEHTVICEGAWIGPCVTFVNDQYPQTGGEHRKGASVKHRAIIGANATIMAGVVIGADAIVGAGSVVTHDVPPGEVWAGNPATKRKERKDLAAYVVS